MKKIVLLFAISLVLSSCTGDDQKPAIVVLEEVERGAFLRTLETINSEFDINNLDSEFDIRIQEQDLEDGELMEAVDVYLKFLDNSESGTDYTTNERLIQTFLPTEFGEGAFGLPIKDLRYSFQELLDFAQVDHANVACKDQFEIRLDLRLSTGISFSEGNSSGCILGIDTFFSSPFTYTVNIVEPIAADLFTGNYVYESVLDGAFGPTWGPSFNVEIKKGRSDNLRTVTFDNFPLRSPRVYYFSIVCDESVIEKYQLRYNTYSFSCGENGQPIIIGPDTVNATINPLDDSVFELWFVEGYKGFDGDFGFGTVPSRIKFTKQ